MNVIINQTYKTCRMVYFEASCGATSATVGYGLEDKSVSVVCGNASNRVWKGTGRTFVSIDAALESYKSEAMRLIINATRALANRSVFGSQPI